MSTMRQNKFEGLCRLCTSVENNNLHIFGDEGEFRQLASKIRICLPIFVHREDTLPKVVCLPCVTKLESFYNFREACVKAEGTLEAYLKEEQNFPHEPEICLEEVTTAKECDTVNSECEKDDDNVDPEKRKAEKQPRGRRKRKSASDRPAPQGGRKAKRGKVVKVTEQPKDPPPVPEEIADSDQKEDAVEEKKRIEAVKLPLEELPIPLAPASNISQMLVPQMGELHPNDYILVKEEKFLAGANWGFNNMFPPNNGSFSVIKEEIVEGMVTKDGECLDLHGGGIVGMKTEKEAENFMTRQTRQFLPPVWDVFEKVVNGSQGGGQETSVVTHRRYIVAKRAFPCALCGNCFMLSGAGDIMVNGRGAGTRTRYMNSEHGGEPIERPFGCLRCDKRYFRRSDLIRHEKTHLAARPFVCSLCGKGFCRKEHAQRHMSLHVGEKPFQCEACLKPFTRKEHLARHQRCHHPEALYNAEGTYNYGDAVDQENSMREEANGSNKVQDVSGSVPSPKSTGMPTKPPHQRQLVDKSAMMEAMKGFPKRPYECEICVQAFSRREHLVRHRRSHFREQMKGVSLTLSANRQVIRMGEEMDMSEPPSSLVDTVIDGLEDDEEEEKETTEQSCRYCTLTFSTREELERHQSRMHPLAEAVSAMVPQSEEALADLYGTMRKPVSRSPSPPHLVSEERLPEAGPVDGGSAGKQAFACILCPNSFSRKENLERHLKTVHVRLKPYVCQWCGKRFGRTELCRRHENRHLQKQTGHDGDVEIVTPKLAAPPQGPATQGGGVVSKSKEAHDAKKSTNHQSKVSSSPCGPSMNNSELENGSGDTVVAVEHGVGNSMNGQDVETGKVKHSRSRGAKKKDSNEQVSHQSSKGSKRVKVYTCQICGMEFSKKKHLSKHGSTHA